MKWALMAMVSACMFFSCKKDEDKPSGCEINKANLSGSYKFTAVEYKQSASATPVNYMQFMEDCEKDNILELRNDGTYEYKDAGNVCASHEVEKGSWNLQGHILTLDDEPLPGTITSFDCKTLVYYVENGITDGDRMTYTMTKQ